MRANEIPTRRCGTLFDHARELAMSKILEDNAMIFKQRVALELKITVIKSDGIAGFSISSTRFRRP
jgi:hypothetical protein